MNYREKISIQREQRRASENISKIFNPNNKFKRRQKDILKSIFG